MKQGIKKLINKLINLFGYSIIKNKHLEPIDLRKHNNPKALYYFTNTDRQIIIDAKLSNGRGLDIFSLENNNQHPFIYAVYQALKNKGHEKEVMYKILKKYYTLVQPNSISEWLGLNKGDSTLLDSQPAWASLLPWENINIEIKKKERMVCAAYDNEEHGLCSNIESGWRNFGPVTNEVLNLEVNRLYKLIISIQKHGFLRHNKFGGDIGAIILFNEKNDWRWLVEWGGQHRAAVISALGYEKITIRGWKIVQRSDVEIWPGVRNGIYSKTNALKVFDNIFNANSDSFIYNNWRIHESINSK